jgi:hypothetical protein
MKNYVAVDTLNPNAVNARYGRPADLCGIFEVAVAFSAASEEEAVDEFYRLCEAGEVGYSDSNTQRGECRLYRSKDWYKNGIEGTRIA